MTFLSSFISVQNNFKKTKTNIWRKYVERFLGRFFAVPFVYFDFNPNVITFFRFILEITGVFFFLNRYFILGITLIFLGRVFDSVDGNVARALDKTSAWGRYLDEIADMVAKIILWSAISFILFESYSQGKSHIIFSYLALSVPLLELLMFHARDRASLYKHRGENKDGKEMKELKKIPSNSIFYKIKSFFKFLSDFIPMFWLGINFPFFVLSVIFGILHIYVGFAFFFWFLIFSFEFLRKVFYDKLMLERYPL
ncbi:MAG: CDP-alcohol phosphatidyltransferase family protein [Candidatus Pacebacteria bacterium]|nr:CDP-alcohol phosphatidyltransferase family protein [Candidatus Paceibacterota bacterium]MDD5446091.1 CDP-alcohol phosphatidyltransferase family protein [Candidatus Paceibacterota bacterium]